MVWTTIGRAVGAARKDGDDVHAALADRIGSDDRDATVHAGCVLVNDIAERVALNGDLPALFDFVVQLDQKLDKAAGDARDIIELVAVEHVPIPRGLAD